MKELENLPENRAGSKQTGESGNFLIESGLRRVAQQRISLLPLRHGTNCDRGETCRDEKLNNCLRPRKSSDECGAVSDSTIQSLQETDKLPGEGHNIENIRVERRGRKQLESSKLSRSNEDNNKKELVKGEELKPYGYQASCCKVGGGDSCREWSLMEQLPFKNAPIKSHETGNSSSLILMPIKKENTNYDSVPDVSVKKLSLGIDYPKSKHHLHSRNMRSQMVNSIARSKCPKERRKSESGRLNLNSVHGGSSCEILHRQNHYKKLSREGVNVVKIQEADFPLSAIKNSEILSSCKSKVEDKVLTDSLKPNSSSEDHDSTKEHEGETTDQRQRLLRRRWSIERINSYDFGSNRAAKAGSKSFAAENVGKDSVPSVPDHLSKNHRSKSCKVRYVDGNARGRSDAIPAENPKRIPFTGTVQPNSRRSSSKREIKRKHKNLDSFESIHFIPKVNERGSRAVKSKAVARVTKTNVKALEQGDTSLLGEKRIAVKALLQEGYEGSDDDCYSDDENWKDVRIIMTNVRLKGILKKSRRAGLKNVTFNRKVKMKIFNYL